jgi:hypothetical protein
MNDGNYGCKKSPSYYEVVIIIPILFGLIIAAIIFAIIWWKKNRFVYDIQLSNSLNWFWDHKRIIDEKYVYKTDIEPPYFFKELKEDSKSKEVILFNQFREYLDFGEIKVANFWAICSRVLATSMSNVFSVQKARFVTSPDKFCSQKSWQNKNRDHRQKVINMFLQRCHNWEWNSNLDISKGLLLPMVHGTELSLGWKIASAGFATLSTLDAGFYGRGIYFSSSAMYTLPYFANKRRPAILICLTAPGNPFPVIESPNKDHSMLGRPMISGFQSHYAITTVSGFPPSDKKFDSVKKYDELVISQEAQIVPMYLVEIDTSNLPVLINYFMVQKNTKKRPEEEDSDEQRSMEGSVHGDNPNALSNQSRRMNQSKDPKKKEGEPRRFDQSNSNKQSQKRKVEERKIEQSDE